MVKKTVSVSWSETANYHEYVEIEVPEEVAEEGDEALWEWLEEDDDRWFNAVSDTALMAPTDIEHRELHEAAIIIPKVPKHMPNERGDCPSCVCSVPQD